MALARVLGLLMATATAVLAQDAVTAAGVTPWATSRTFASATGLASSTPVVSCIYRDPVNRTNVYLCVASMGSVMRATAPVTTWPATNPMVTATRYAGSNAAGTSTGDGGAATNATMRTPVAVVVSAGPNANETSAYILDAGNRNIRRVSANGTISTYYTFDAGATGLKSMTIDGEGNLYVGDVTPGSYYIYRITTPTPDMTIVAGTGVAGTGGDGGAPAAAQVYPYAIRWRAAAGTLLVYSPLHGNVRELDFANGVVRRVMGGDAPTARALTNKMSVTNATALSQGIPSGWANESFVNVSTAIQGFDVAPNDNAVICGGLSVIGFKVGGNGTHAINVAAVYASACAIDFDFAGVLVTATMASPGTAYNIMWYRGQSVAGTPSPSGYGDGNPCPAGSYSAAGATSCTPCVSGKFNTVNGSATCTACPWGYGTAGQGATACVQCAAGFEEVNNVCTACSAYTVVPAGTHRTGGSSMCTSCGVGSAPSAAKDVCATCAPGQWGPGNGVCYTCSDNRYSLAGQSSCQTCPTAWFARGGDANCTACPAGTYGRSAGNGCVTCDAGKYQPFTNSTTCLSCPAGTASSAPGATSPDTCVPCTPGTISNSGWSACGGCAYGDYSTTYGATACQTCRIDGYGPQRQVTPAAGWSTCSLLSRPPLRGVVLQGATPYVGYLVTDSYLAAYDTSVGAGKQFVQRSDNVTYSNLRLGAVVAAVSDAAGDTAYIVTASRTVVAATLSTLTNTNRTLALPAYVNATAAAVDAAGGFLYVASWRASTGAATLHQISVAGSGPITDTGANITLGGGSVLLPPIIATAVGATYAYFVSGMAAGSTVYVARLPLAAAAANLAGATVTVLPVAVAGAPVAAVLSGGRLVIATAGSGLIAVDAATLTVTGNITLADETAVLDCANPLVMAPGPAAAGPSVALACFASTGTEARVVYVNTTAFARTGAQKLDAVFKTVLALVASDAGVGVATPSLHVMANAYPSNPPTEAVRIPARLCPGGQAPNAVGDCSNCTTGKYAAPGFLACQSCPFGTYGPTGGAAACVECGAGWYNSAPGSTAFSACARCAPGTASAKSGKACTACAPGTYAASNTSATCTLCAAGTFSTLTGRTQACDACPPGTYSAPGSASCTLCPARTYASGFGAGACTMCPRGTTNTAPGGTACYPVPTANITLPKASPSAGAPGAVALDPAGTVFTAYPANGTVVAVAPGGVSTIVFTGLGKPVGIAAYATGAAFVVDSAGGILWHVRTSDASTMSIASGLATASGSDAGASSVSVALNGTVYVLESKTTGSRVVAVTPTWSGRRLQASTTTVVVTAGGGSPIGANPNAMVLNTSAAGGDTVLLGTRNGAVLTVSTDGAGTVTVWYTVSGGAAVSLMTIDPSTGKLAIIAGAGGTVVTTAATPAVVSTFAAPAGSAIASIAFDPATGAIVIADAATGSVTSGQLCNSPSLGTGFMQPCASCGPGDAPQPDGTCVACLPGTSALPGAAACTPCPLGTYSPVPQEGSCTPCPAGTYTLTYGADSLSLCVPCPAGTYSHAGNGRCLPAPAGTYVALPGSAVSAVKQCPKGYFSPLPGSAACDVCPALTVSEAGATSCTMCPLPDVSSTPLVTRGFGYRGRSNVCPARPMLDNDDYTAGASAGGFFYFGLGAAAPYIVKVEGLTLTKVANASLGAVRGPVMCTVVDTGANVLYAATADNTLVKVDLATMARVSSVSLAAGSAGIVSTACAMAAGTAYFTVNGTIVSVTLSSMTVANTLVTPNATGFGGVAVDAVSGLGYFGAHNAAGTTATISIVRLSTLTLLATPALQLDSSNINFLALLTAPGGIRGMWLGGDGSVYFVQQFFTTFDGSAWTALFGRYNINTGATRFVELPDRFPQQLATPWTAVGAPVGQAGPNADGELYFVQGLRPLALSIRGLMSVRIVNEARPLWPTTGVTTGAAVDPVSGRMVMAMRVGAKLNAGQTLPAWAPAGSALLVGVRTDDAEVAAVSPDAYGLSGVTVVDAAWNHTYVFSLGDWTGYNTYMKKAPVMVRMVPSARVPGGLVQDAAIPLASDFYCANLQGTGRCTADPQCNQYLDTGCRMVAALGVCALDSPNQILWCGTAHAGGNTGLYNMLVGIDFGGNSGWPERVRYHRIAMGSGSANAFVGVAVADTGKVYLTDGSNYGVREFDPSWSASTWSYVPVGLMGSGYGNLGCMVTWNATVYVHSSNGVLVKMRQGNAVGTITAAYLTEVRGCSVSPNGTAFFGVYSGSTNYVAAVDLISGARIMWAAFPGNTCYGCNDVNSPYGGSGGLGWGGNAFIAGAGPIHIPATNALIAPTANGPLHVDLGARGFIGGATTVYDARALTLAQGTPHVGAVVAVPSRPGLVAISATTYDVDLQESSLSLLAAQSCAINEARSGPNGEGSCQACRAGTVATYGSRNCVACTPGTYTGGQGQFNGCDLCSAGTYQPTYGAVGSSSCLTCPAGSWSDRAYPTCSLCPGGSYSAALGATSASTCQLCPAGTYQPNRGAASLTECLTCPPGQISLAGATSCFPCNVGYNKTAPFAATCTACPINTYNDGSAASQGNSTCINCPASAPYTTSTGSTSVSQCGAGCWAGYFPNSGACNTCYGGMACAGGFAAPVACYGATPYVNANKSACIPPATTCDSGYYLQSGQCIACTPGSSYYCPGGVSPSVYCGAGGVVNATGNGCTFNSCASQYYLNNGQCDLCPANFTCSGGTSAPAACPAGQVSQPGAYYCLAMSTSCSAGRYLSGGVCNACPAGSFCAGGTAQPASCTGGQIPNAGATACVAPASSCPPGQYLSSGVCAACTYNNFCAGGTAQPASCPGGQIPNATYSASGCITPVASCPPGQYISSGLCAACGQGPYSYCPGGAFTYAQSCTGGQVASADHTSCVAAPTSCSPGFYLANSLCNACPFSSACPGGTAQSTYCPNGVNVTTQTCNAGATSCPPGQYLLGGSCLGCLGGHACAGGTSQPVSCPYGMTDQLMTQCVAPATSCPAGEYVNNGICMWCSTGYYCTGGANPPTPCPNGAPSPGHSSSVSQCIVSCVGVPPTSLQTSCTGANFVSCVAGQYTCVAVPASCPANQMADLSTSPVACTGVSGGTPTCPAGQYVTSISSGSPPVVTFTCSACPAGFTCPGGAGAPAFKATTNPPTCAAGENSYPVTVPPANITYNCLKGFGNIGSANSLVAYCDAGTSRLSGAGPVCTPCRSGCTCAGGHARADCSGGGVAPSASSTPTPTPTPSPSPAPASQEILVPYEYAVPPSAQCNASVVDDILNPGLGIGTGVRAAFAGALGYTMQSSFISGVIACGGNYTFVAPDAPINVANGTVARRLMQGRAGGLTLVGARRLDGGSVRSINITVEGNAVVIELGVAVPSAIAPHLARFLQAVMGGESAANIAAAAAALTAALADPSLNAWAESQPSSSADGARSLLPTTLLQFVGNATVNASSVAQLQTTLADAPSVALPALARLLNVSADSLNTSVITSELRVGAIALPPRVQPPAILPASEGGSGGSGLVGLVAIPIVFIFCFGAVWYRRKSQADAAASKAVKTAEPGTVVVIANGFDAVVPGAQPAVAAGDDASFTQVNPLQQHRGIAAPAVRNPHALASAAAEPAAGPVDGQAALDGDEPAAPGRFVAAPTAAAV